MEGGSLSKRGSRLSAAHSRFKKLQELHGLRAGGFQNVTLALAPRTSAFKTCARVSRIEGGSFSKCGSRLSAANIPFYVQELHGLRTDGFQNAALVLAPRTFALTMCNSFTD
eukprot:8252317-Pyramimonas_sp.AAC.1